MTPTELQQLSSNELKDLLFIERLENQILTLLENDFTALVNLLYKIDVSEKLVTQAFHNGIETPLIAKAITTLIIQRLEDKIALRAKYKSS
jgi:hypothetical protein